MARPRKNPAPVAPAQVMPGPSFQPMVAAPQQAMIQPAPPASMPVMPPQASGDAITMSRAEYVRVRDSVHSRISMLQSLIQDFAADYLRQSNLLLGEHTSLENIPNLHSLAALDHHALNFGGHMGEPMMPPQEEKKERKKRVHDPNAPKRPLTPYFLYMQTARPIIANDLGAEVPKGAVQEEGQRRWAAMSGEEKVGWNNAYQYNLRLYNARVHSYKSGNLVAREMTDAEALAYADANGVPQPKLDNPEELGNDHDAIAEQLQLATTSSAPVPLPPAAAAAVAPATTETPKGKGGRKRKSTAAAEEPEEASAAKIATPASPDKKRKRASKAAETPAEEPKKSGRKKKAA